MILDNEAPIELFSFFNRESIGFQKVPPYSKRTNRAERAIQTFRRHVLGILTSSYPNFLIGSSSFRRPIIGRCLPIPSPSTRFRIASDPARRCPRQSSDSSDTTSFLLLTPIGHIIGQLRLRLRLNHLLPRAIGLTRRQLLRPASLLHGTLPLPSSRRRKLRC
jgi:hypothetical protein